MAWKLLKQREGAAEARPRNMSYSVSQKEPYLWAPDGSRLIDVCTYVRAGCQEQQLRYPVIDRKVDKGWQASSN